MPDVSVIIAAWNAQETIRAAIASALDQVGLSTEVVVVDDRSTDGTAAVVASLADPRIKLRISGSNGGPAAARNTALQAADGDWIAVLDADDTWAPDRLARLLLRASVHDLDIVADNMWIVSPGGSRRLCIEEQSDGTMERVTLESFCLANRLFAGRHGYGYLKPVFRASFLHRTATVYDESLRIGEDFKIVIDGLARGARYGRVRCAYYNYHLGTGSLSRRLSLQDAAAMLSADRQFLATFAATLAPAERNAVERHLRSLHDGVSFITMVDGLKQRLPWTVARQAMRSPKALRHFRMPIQARLHRIGQRFLAVTRHTADICSGALAGEA